MYEVKIYLYGRLERTATFQDLQHAISAVTFGDNDLFMSDTLHPIGSCDPLGEYMASGKVALTKPTIDFEGADSTSFCVGLVFRYSPDLVIFFDEPYILDAAKEE